MTQETVSIFKALLDLGLSGILLSFIYVIWKDRQDNTVVKDGVIKDKDIELAKLNAKVLEVIESNIKVNVGLENSIDSNTKAVDNLSKAVYEVLLRGNK